ncbi:MULTISPECIES: NAD(P)/FAD-dependent oxidoreductase [Mesorhizobium]|uniref:FAD-dependent oxidoreductase n=1 Tax=Rhizobium loti TaxID=381 RepID=A0A6M7TXH7_RHILI|nr:MULTISPECIES: FAD-binding oxidoreductase [Mesorhizobium]KRB19491.1 FAD-dependent oxidoreductase [Mesorhizobium sp. Root172]OBQ59936.1 FAD-dependent oxidoreductase [Mesorhizobium loti]QKC69502.1 FAD-binding oxidoreductase [Mesorhizobium loti]QKC88798.1 FAD-binding oxidoreductase [Mesorhizobium sp. NZP2234]
MPRKLDLRTGRPVWSAYRAPAVPTSALTRDVKTDVLIIGMGISGAMMAEALTADGHSVICIDRRGPLKGSTAATTALVQFEIDQPLSMLSKMIGRARAEQAWRRSRLAVSNLAGRIEDLAIDCRPRRSQSLYLAGTMLGPSELRDEAEARRQAGIAASYLTPRPLAETFGIDRDGAILSHDNIALDPRKLTAGLLLRALARKARLYAPVEATAIKDSTDEVVVATKDGPTITARHVVLATGYELVDIVPAAAHQIISTWAIATRPQPRKLWPGAAFIWEASDPYLYVRATADGRVICGGEDEDFVDETRRDELIADKAARIAEKLGLVFPQLDVRPEFAWTGSFGTTTTGLPYIGAIPRHPRIHAVMGYGGNGITFSRIASEIVSASIKGMTDADAELFAFNR